MHTARHNPYAQEAKTSRARPERCGRHCRRSERKRAGGRLRDFVTLSFVFASRPASSTELGALLHGARFPRLISAGVEANYHRTVEPSRATERRCPTIRPPLDSCSDFLRSTTSRT